MQSHSTTLAKRATVSLGAQLACLAAGAAVFGLLLVISVAPHFQKGPAIGSAEDQFATVLNQAVPASLHHFRVPGVVVSTIVHGAPSRTYAYGLADVQNAKPMTQDTVFRVASLSKSVTAWGILGLAGHDRIDLDAPVENYLADWPLPPSPFSKSQITTRNLLTYTSGLNAGLDTFRRPDEPALTTLAVLKSKGVDSDPSSTPAAQVRAAGQGFQYSVYGYMMLQLVLEDQTGEPFADYMDHAVLKPLGMLSSSFSWEDGLRSRTAIPYLANGQRQDMLIPQDSAADGLFSTGPDMARFLAAPLPDPMVPVGGGVIPEKLVEELYRNPIEVPSLSVAGLAPDLPTLGYYVEKMPGGLSIVTNGGLDPGWTSRFYMVPSSGDGIVILTNSDRGQPVIAQIASIWSSWRGLPAGQITSAYRALSLAAAGGSGILISLALLFSLEHSNNSGPSSSLCPLTLTTLIVEWIVALAPLGIWIAGYKIIRSLPFLAVASGLSILFLLGVVAARSAYFAAARFNDAAPSTTNASVDAVASA